MSLAELRAELEALSERPAEEWVARIATTLQDHTLLVPILQYDQATGVLELLTGKDASGAAWIYVYTGEDVMIANGLAGARCGRFKLLEVVRMGRSGNFGGIVIDQGETGARGYIPCDRFAEAEHALGGD